LGRKQKDAISSCFECIAIKSCYDSTQPDMNRVEARHKAFSCTSLRKGLSTEKIHIVGYEKGLSRKNAEIFVNKGIAKWVKHKTIEFTNEPPNRFKKYLIQNTKEKLSDFTLDIWKWGSER
jgi:hypothetical protein